MIDENSTKAEVLQDGGVLLYAQDNLFYDDCEIILVGAIEQEVKND